MARGPGPLDPGARPGPGAGELSEAGAGSRPLAGQGQQPRFGVLYMAIWLFTQPLLWLVFPTRRRGASQVPRRGGALLCANHQSWLDILLIGSSVFRPVRFVARETLGKHPWLDFAMRRCGTVRIRRGAPDRGALGQIASLLEAGELVAIFPEGTRTQDGSVGPFLGGALLAARRAGAPLVAVGLNGSYDAWPRGRRWPRPHRLRIAFGAPVPPREADLEALRAQVASLAGVGLVPRAGPENPPEPGQRA